MTRPIEQIEADLVTARQAHQGVVAAHQQAVRTATELRAKATAGDSSVTAKALGDAMHAAEFAELPIPAKLRAITALETERLVVETELWADQVAATEPALRADVEHAFEALEAVLDNLVTAWRIHGQFVHNTAVDVGSVVSADVTPRVRRAAFGVVVDGAQIRPVPVHERLQKMAQTAHQRLLAGNPKAQV